MYDRFDKTCSQFRKDQCNHPFSTGLQEEANQGLEMPENDPFRDVGAYTFAIQNAVLRSQVAH